MALIGFGFRLSELAEMELGEIGYWAALAAPYLRTPEVQDEDR